MTLRPLHLAAFLLSLLVTGLAGPTAAQFSPAIQVGDRVVTGFELDQRRRLLEVFRTPGDLDELAREQLIEDRLKQELLDRAGLSITPETLATELDAFAGRANLEYAQFVQLLGQNGIEEETLRDFVEIGVSWRDYIRARFGSQAQISDAEVDRALGQAGTGGEGIEVLLSEIIIPAPPPRAAQANSIANQISQTTSQGTFEAAARQYSALPSRANGGRLGWLPIANYPPQLRSLLLGLSIGEVTPPIQIPNGVALFQMRGVREVPSAPAAPASIDYATFYLPGGRSASGLQAAEALKNRVDTCDDLYGAARGLPENVLDRDSVAPAEIPQDVALELARLDAGEVSYNLTTPDGQTLIFLMLCNRVAAGAEAIDREAIRNQLRSQRLEGYAAGVLADLRAATVIR